MMRRYNRPTRLPRPPRVRCGGCGELVGAPWPEGCQCEWSDEDEPGRGREPKEE